MASPCSEFRDGLLKPKQNCKKKLSILEFFLILKTKSGSKTITVQEVTLKQSIESSSIIDTISLIYNITV